MATSPPITYRDAGVDIDRGNALVERIKPLAQATYRDGVLSGVGGFGALFAVPMGRFSEPVLVSGADGVGTKLKLAIELGVHDTVGIDLVAMCANDILVLGAQPLFFLDYFATAQIDPQVAEAIISGIATGCQLAGAALVGGECAEMPGMYRRKDYDLAGFCVGVVERRKIIDPQRVMPGDVLIGLASSGLHANGFSLVHKLLDETGHPLDTNFGENTLGRELLAPTRIYIKPVLALLESIDVHAMAHITGGGLTENIARALPDGVWADIDSQCWSRSVLFDWIEAESRLPAQEMYRTFNCGIGFVLIVASEDAKNTLSQLHEMGEMAWIIGHARAGTPSQVSIK